MSNYMLIGDNDLIFWVNFLGLLFFYLLILFCMKFGSYNEIQLVFWVFLYNIVFVLLNIYLFYLYTGEIFEFTGSDSHSYHLFASEYSKLPLIEGIKKFTSFTKYSFDDTGYVFYLSTLYSIFNSPLICRIFNVLLNTFTVILLFRIAKNFMHVKYAFIASMVFGISSYTVYYQSSGLKETLMLLILVLAYYHYYEYLSKSYVKHIILFIFFTLVLMFFRVPLVIFILASVIITEYLKRGRKTNRILITVLALGVVTYIGLIYTEYLTMYVRRFNPTLYTKSGLVAPGNFLRITSIFAGIFGPFPTVTPIEGNQDTVMHASSLILKGFLSTYFIFSFYLCLKRKEFLAFPLILFCILQIVSLSYLVHTFKFRNQFPHMAFLILASFYVINILFHEEGYRRIRKIIFGINFLLVIALFSWNYLRFS